MTFITRDLEQNAILFGNRRLARKFLENGQRVDFVGLDKADPEACSSIPHGSNWLALDARRVRQQVIKLARYFRIHRPSVVFVSGFNEGLACVAASWLVAEPPKMVVRVHIVASVYLAAQESLFDRYLAKHVMAWAFKPPVKIVAVSAAAARDFERLLRYECGSVAKVYDPVLDGGIRPPARCIHPWLANDEVRLILAAGVLIPRKDFRTLIRAFEKVRKEDPRFRLLIAGEGAQREDLQNLIYELGLSKFIALPGFVANLDLPYDRADLFVSSSLYEGLGNVIVEALAAGCRVVSTDCPVGPAEILECGKHGQLVPVGDVNALANAILRAPSLPFDRHGAVARAMDFHIDNVWPQFLRLAGPLT